MRTQLSARLSVTVSRGIEFMPSTLELLRDMIAIPSVNPMRVNGGEPARITAPMEARWQKW